MSSGSEPDLDFKGRATEAILYLSKATCSLSPQDLRLLSRVAEASKDVLHTAAQELVADAAGAPLLSSKSADGAPLNFSFRYRAKLPTGKAVVSSGQQAHSFMVQNQLFGGFLHLGQ